MSVVIVPHLPSPVSPHTLASIIPRVESFSFLAAEEILHLDF